MVKTATIDSKRLIGLAPTSWVQWVTGDPTAETLEILFRESGSVSDAANVLVKARSSRHGTFLVANEILFRPNAALVERFRASAAQLEEQYVLDVYPVVVNLLPPKHDPAIVASYLSEFMDLVAYQDYRVLNLWEVDASLVLQENWAPLLPFVPVMRGGDDRGSISRALALLRADDRLADAEPLLAFFAAFVMPVHEVTSKMRWDMAVLRETPWYDEIVNECVEECFEKGLQLALQRDQLERLWRVQYRLGDVSLRDLMLCMQCSSVV